MKYILKIQLITVIFCMFICCSIGIAEDVFTIGVPPFTDPAKLEQSFQPFTKYMAEVTGKPTKLLVCESYEDFADRLVKNEISLGFSTSVLYVTTKEKNPENIHYLAMCLQKNEKGKSRSHYFGFFLVSANSPYKSLNDLKGKKWGFTKKSSSSGYQYPMASFAKKGIQPDEYFSEVKFLKKHSMVTDALAGWKEGADNIIDGGATWDVNIWEAEKKHGKVFRKIFRVGPIPMQAVVVSQKIHEDKDLVEKIKTALIQNVPENVTNIQGFPYSGWEAGSDRKFDIVRNVVKQNRK